MSLRAREKKRERERKKGKPGASYTRKRAPDINFAEQEEEEGPTDHRKSFPSGLGYNSRGGEKTTSHRGFLLRRPRDTESGKVFGGGRMMMKVLGFFFPGFEAVGLSFPASAGRCGRMDVRLEEERSTDCAVFIGYSSGSFFL